MIGSRPAASGREDPEGDVADTLPAPELRSLVHINLLAAFSGLDCHVEVSEWWLAAAADQHFTGQKAAAVAGQAPKYNPEASKVRSSPGRMISILAAEC
ncbi:hypothetical protein HL653_05630 [Sphingomonas sp. AP4-R1]|uniref:hypothetical protein n=1 Tax=Sphingomonas sp. AP4-R1 TaxID=2735134 RepID=UPI001493D019|nr:hypothetical protein [Sphingomonas sp. AP4-R1]QJU57336.1 hypothetical protein HL653_05630 [Sphingomonas sp. AP4-R1]